MSKSTGSAEPELPPELLNLAGLFGEMMAKAVDSTFYDPPKDVPPSPTPSKGTKASKLAYDPIADLALARARRAVELGHDMGPLNAVFAAEKQALLQAERATAGDSIAKDIKRRRRMRAAPVPSHEDR